jgi:hypothetical protein
MKAKELGTFSLITEAKNMGGLKEVDDACEPSMNNV